MHGIITDIAMLAINDNSLGNVNIGILRRTERILTSSPVCATIWAARKEGSPKKVMMGCDPARKELRRRSCGFCTNVVMGDLYMAEVLMVA